MKIILLSTLVGLTLPLFANEAKLIMISAGAGLPEGVDFSAKPMGYEFGTKLTFFIEGKNLISFDKESVTADGWKLGSFPKVSKDGTQASFTITKKGNFMNKLDALKVAGSIALNSAEKTEKVTAAVTVKEEQNLGPYTVQLKIKAGAEWGNGVTVKGKLENVKEVTVKQGDKVLKSSGWGGFNQQRTYNFKGIKDGAQVSIEYWGDTKKVTYKFSK